MKSSSKRFIFLVIHVVSMSHFICIISATCDMPHPIPNTNTTLSDPTLSIGSYIIWECIDGYMMQGETNTVIWVCSEDGSWLGHSPMCKAIECPSPPIAAYSTLDPPLIEAHMVNQTISYTCSSDQYTLIGNTSNTCLQDGTWRDDPPTCQRRCTTDAKRYSDLTCYRTSNTRRTWYGSFKFCDDEGELLVTVKDDNTQQFIATLTEEELDRNVWIGAMEGRDWKWRQSDTYIERFFWENAYPDPDASSKDCIELSYKNDLGKFTWSPRTPGDGIGVLCQFNETCLSAGLHQSDMVLDYIGNCFQFLNVSMDCAEGDTECRTRGGFLAEIIDESTNALLVDQALYLREKNIVAENTGWWIGGYDDDNNTERSWYWSDKTRVIYKVWRSDRPDNIEDECIEMRTAQNYRWDDTSCSERRWTLCQIGIPACGDPGQPLHGNRLPDDRTTYSVNAILHFTCMEGYTLTGADILRCTNNGTWDQQTPTCEAVICEGNPPEVALASNVTLGWTYQDITVYTCQDGYIPDNEPISYCQFTGNWSTQNFTCTALSPCYVNPCMNGGTCSVNGSSFTCTCPSSLTGVTCNEELGACYSSPCMNGGICNDVDGSSFICKCPSSYTGLTCHEDISLTTSFTLTTQAPSQSTQSQTGGAASPYGAIAAGSAVAVILIFLVIVSVILFRRRRTNKPVFPDNENEMENYASVENCYQDSKPMSSTPRTPHYLTILPDSNGNGRFGATSVAKQPSPHLQKGGAQKDQPFLIKDSNNWNEEDNGDAFVDNVLYGTPDEQSDRPSSSNSTFDKIKPGMETKNSSNESRRSGNFLSGVPDENVYESYEDDDIIVDNELCNAVSPPTLRDNKSGVVDDQVNEEVYENPDENVYANLKDEENLIENELYNAASPPTTRDHKLDAVVDQGNDEVYENPDGNVYEVYEEEAAMVDNALYRAATPPSPLTCNSNPMINEGNGDMYQNTEFHEVPTNLITNELYKSVDEI